MREIDVDKIEFLIKNYMESCENYINNDLYDYKKITLKINNKISIEKDEINARAKVDEKNEYSVEIFMAAYIWINNFYNDLLHNEKFYSIVSGEDEYDESKANIYYNILLEITIKTIIFHELGHIYNGHVDYIKSKQGSKEFTLNAFDNNRGFLKPICWQALEWNADDFAASRIIGQVTYKDFTEKYEICDDVKGLWLATIAIIIVYALKDMGLKNHNNVNYQQQEHLPKRFRVEQYIKAEIHAYKFLNNKELPHDIDVQLMKAMEVVEEWVNLYKKSIDESNGKEWGIHNNLAELDKDHREYYEKVEGYYLVELPMELKPYSYFKIIDDSTEKKSY